MRASIAVVLLLSSAWLLSACEDKAEQRALGEERVGHLETAQGRLDIEDGLAVIEAFGPERIGLWSSAPSFTAELERDEPVPLEVVIANTLPGSTVSFWDESGESLPVDQLPQDCATRQGVTLFSLARHVTFSLSAPKPPARSNLRFAVVGDIQEAVDRIGDVLERIAAEPGLSFVLCTGDLTSHGTDAELRRIRREIEALPLPFYTTLGNHELGTDPPRVWDWFGRGSLHFHHRDVAFSLLDSASATLANRTEERLDEWLDEDRDRLHVVATHYPPVDPIGVRNGSFASRADAHRLLSRLAAGGVDLTLYGHIHSYYHFQNAGIDAHISGGGGAIPERFDDIGRHFLVVEVSDGGEASVRVVRVDQGP